jgi:hypothetical protein
MVTVQDGLTGKPLSGATVELSSGGYDQTQVTGQGYFKQTDWSGSNSSQSFGLSTANEYANDNNFIDTKTASSTGSIQLRWDGFNPYNTNATGILESSTFDTGTTSNFYALDWAPNSQPVLAGNTPVEFQIATAPSSSPNGPWTYVGPDGTAGTFFTASGGTINALNNNAEYFRYKAYLNTATATVTPSVNDVSFTYTSGCIPPGQVIFQGLSTGNYTLTISASGHTTSSSNIMISPGWQNKTVGL